MHRLDPQWQGGAKMHSKGQRPQPQSSVWPARRMECAAHSVTKRVFIGSRATPEAKGIGAGHAVAHMVRPLRHPLPRRHMFRMSSRVDARALVVSRRKWVSPKATRGVPVQDLRKVQETNKRTLIISLPKRWGDRFPVTAGDHVQLELQADGSVIMRRQGPGASPTPPAIVAGGLGPDEVLARMAGPFLQGVSSLAITDVRTWSEADTGRFRLAARERFGGEVTDEPGDELQVLFLGADRPEQLAVACRRLVQLACAALAGEDVDAQAIERHRMLGARLLFLAGRRPDAAFDTAAATIVLQLGAMASMIASAAPGRPPASPAAIEAFREAALAALQGHGPTPIPAAAEAQGSDWLACAAARSLSPWR